MPLFHIHEVTGEITIANEVDRDSGEVNENSGVCELTIQVN